MMSLVSFNGISDESIVAREDDSIQMFDMRTTPVSAWPRREARIHPMITKVTLWKGSTSCCITYRVDFSCPYPVTDPLSGISMGF